MSRALLITVVAFAAFAIVNVTASIAVAVLWRFRIAAASAGSPPDRARQLLWWRGAPGAISLFITLAIVLPAFVIFEPRGGSEAVGPFLVGFAMAALLVCGASAWIGVRAAFDTHIAVRAWLRSASPLDVDPPAGVPAFAVRSAVPIVALVGVFRPKLLAAQAVIDACTAAELNAIVSHERGHLRSRDNFKRWLMACAPDALRWTPIHHQMVSAWHDATEDAADDGATDGSDAARADLAALLVKIARLTPEPAWPAVAVSPFVERDGLSRRVTRLLESQAAGRRSPALAPLAAVIAAAVAATVSSSPGLLKSVFDAVEMLVALGR